MIHSVAALLALYVWLRLILPLRCGVPAKVVLGALLAVAAEHHLVTRNFFGSMASPEIPGLLIAVLGALFFALALTAVLLLVLDLAGLVAWLFARTSGRRLLSARRPRLAISALAVVLGAYGAIQAVRVPEVRRIEIVLDALPMAADGFRIVHLTDLHASRLLEREWMAGVVASANRLEPDLVVITGDLADGSVEARRLDIEPLRDLRAPGGMYASPGNHEYYADYRAWMSALEEAGIIMLANRHVTVDLPGGRLALAGVTDQVAERFSQASPDVEAAVRDADPALPLLLLAHRPTLAHAASVAGVDLQLSGHTHGGHVVGMHWLVQRANAGFVSGHYRIGDTQLYVSNGAGLWPGFPIRIGRPSEITEITLRAAARVRNAG